MKHALVVITSSLLSAVLAIFLYRSVEEPQKVFIRETVPVKLTTAGPVADRHPISTPSPGSYIGKPENFIGAAQAVTPAVVNIKSYEDGDYFWGKRSYGASSGSGVIISPDGYIVTNKHVIEDGEEVEVTLNDKREFTAKLVGTDPSTDLALIKIEVEDLPHLGFADSDSVFVGEWVLAVGNPFNLESTVTAGIVSAKGRNIDILEDQYSIESFIQTDAAVNPGNSGGALVNIKGELVGINTAIITRSGRYEGYSFAVPSNLARKVVSDLRLYGEVQRAILGVSIEPVDDERARELELPSIAGVYISRVSPRGGADEAGLRSGDVILSVNEVEVRTVPQLQEQVGRYRPGDQVVVRFFRKGEILEARVNLRNRNNSLELTVASADDILLELGFELRDLTRSEQSRLQTQGVKVTSIFMGSVIERTKMDPDYIITKVNEVEVGSREEVIRALRKAEGKVFLEGFYERYPGEYYYTFAK